MQVYTSVVCVFDHWKSIKQLGNGTDGLTLLGECLLGPSSATGEVLYQNEYEKIILTVSL